MKRAKPAPQPVLDPSLRVNDLLFINAYEAKGFSSPAHIDAYLTVHPKSKRPSARVSAERVLQKPAVKAEIARRIQGERGITREFVQGGLLTACDLALKSNDSDKIRNAYMDCAKLAGLITEKREIKDTTDEQKDAIRSLVRQALTTTGSMFPPKSHDPDSVNSSN